MLDFGSILKRCRKSRIGDKVNCMYDLNTECPLNLLRYVAVVLASWTSFMQVDLSYDSLQSYKN